MEEIFIPLETQPPGNTPVAPSDTDMQNDKGKRHIERLIPKKKWTPISTQSTRKPEISGSRQGKPALITHTGKIAIINSVSISKGKFPKAVEPKFGQRTVKEPEDLGLEIMVDGRTLREILPMLPFTFQFNRKLKPQDWNDMDKVLKLHKLLKDLFQWRMDKKRFNIGSHWEEPEESFERICLKEIPLRDLT
ncbi:hypothetical protein O181_024810 [Austropuccinia psidii MF-1]|uniref:Uncharacterized protein n=1 Tax=Austropuccinia psidii MF-1 TaxID=1389203 RepID=A0A9Q3H0H3_9BASI|nr:hypothetical protein [Austropuccinia psidii MF-1]